jgi:hypothetical protein
MACFFSAEENCGFIDGGCTSGVEGMMFPRGAAVNWLFSLFGLGS